MKKSRMAEALLSCMLCLTLLAGLADAQANSAAEAARIEKIKKHVGELTKDTKSHVEVCLKDKRRVTGQLGEMSGDGFILNESPSGKPLTIAYQDVVTVTNKSHSAFTKFGLTALIGGTLIMTVVAIVAGANGQ